MANTRQTSTTPQARFCAYCGKEIPTSAGNRARFCCAAHKQAAYRQRKAPTLPRQYT